MGGLVRHVDELEKWEEERRRKRIASLGVRREDGEEKNQGEEKASPVDAYKYSPAQIIDGTSKRFPLIGLHRTIAPSMDKTSELDITVS